jgi:hypothetical protein
VLYIINTVPHHWASWKGKQLEAGTNSQNNSQATLNKHTSGHHQ